jgi:hypothetical protein
LGERIELTRKVRERYRKHEFLQSGNCSDQLDAALTDLLVKAAYIEWGLAEINGLRVDGKKIEPGNVIQKGPEALIDEILTAIKNELGLTEEERKN